MIVIMIIMPAQMIIVMIADDDSKLYNYVDETSFVRFGVDDTCVQKGVRR